MGCLAGWAGPLWPLPVPANRRGNPARGGTLTSAGNYSRRDCELGGDCELLFPYSDNAGIDYGLVLLHAPASKTPRGCQDGNQARSSAGAHLTLPLEGYSKPD